jgi:hypothetical protein
MLLVQQFLVISSNSLVIWSLSSRVASLVAHSVHLDVSLAHLDSDENGRKRMEKPYFYFHFYFFFAETGSGSENAGLKTESEYADARKWTNTDGEPEN